MEQLRSTGENILMKYLGKSTKHIEQLLWTATQGKAEDYRQGILQITHDLSQGGSESEIKMNILGWNHPVFAEAAEAYQEQNDFIEHPFEVVEGIQTCRKCGSSRVFAYNKQCRSGDEGTSVFCECTQCHCKWQESG
jgi:DNA-directed RNA polymerase subunit M/transcription elongation factor TFIIS